jgi:predicted signal transduction protein with EAL and GGDEF domain
VPRRKDCATARQLYAAARGKNGIASGFCPIEAPLRTGRLRDHKLFGSLSTIETVLLQESETTLATLYRLRELGVRVAMDDLGTGYPSLSYLQSFPFDKIKIDRSFVRDVAESEGSPNIVRAVASLAKGLGMAATARGWKRTSSSRWSAPRCRATSSASLCRPLTSSDCSSCT